MVNITVVGNKIYLESPYHPDTSNESKKLGGRWSDKKWEFDIRDKERVEDMAKRIYGYGENVVDITYIFRESGKQVFLFGRLVAQRYSRDSSVQLGEGVVIVKGGFSSSGGSARNPDVQGGNEPPTLEIRDAPVNLIDYDDKDITIIKEHAPKNPLESYSYEELIHEIKRRDS